MSSVETDIQKRWEQGTPHHPKSITLFKKLADIDFKFGGDYFCWKSGGDGDNGEHLMYEMDIMFDLQDEEDKKEQREIEEERKANYGLF